MQEISALGRIEQVAGVVVVLLVLADVFMTVLYARADAMLITYHIGQGIWRLFRQGAKAAGKWKGKVLSLCGPVVLISIVGVWAICLALGAALIIHPELGTAVKSSSGGTDTDFITALHAGGNSMSIVGSGSFEPNTTAMRLLFIVNSIIGASVLTLTLTYLMQVYTALQQRNTLALNLYLLSSETGDAAELIAGLGPEGKFDAGYSHLTTLAEDTAKSKESTHFYPVLVYFRFEEPFYSVSQFSLTALDTVTLIRTALDEREYGWLQRSAAVNSLNRSSHMLLHTITSTFREGKVDHSPADERTRSKWKRRFEDACHRLDEAGISTDHKPDAVERYIELRNKWQPFINSLAPAMALRAKDIDAAAA